MAIGEGCFEECYGDFMTTGGGDYDYAAGRQDNGGMGIVDFAEVHNARPLQWMLISNHSEADAASDQSQNLIKEAGIT